ncbi:MAG: IseA DL-endopeptidase inhibitor family protein, partial [Bacilli bacterium]|nr:IseA DL-endopeptidase inhibitor family protein [Bacilli bacterium]
IIVGCLLFFMGDNSKNTNKKETTTTNAIVDENHEIVITLLNKYISGGFTGYDNCLKDDVDESLTIKSDNGNNYAKVRGYSTYEALIKDLELIMSDDLINKIPIDKFIEKDGSLYCYYPQTLTDLFNYDIKIESIDVKDESITGSFTYTTGDKIVHNKKVELVKVEGNWILNNVTGE